MWAITVTLVLGGGFFEAPVLIAMVSSGLCGVSFAFLVWGKDVGSLADWGSPEKGIVPYWRYVQPFVWATLFVIAVAIPEVFVVWGFVTE